MPLQLSRPNQRATGGGLGPNGSSVGHLIRMTPPVPLPNVGPLDYPFRDINKIREVVAAVGENQGYLC